MQIFFWCYKIFLKSRSIELEKICIWLSRSPFHSVRTRFFIFILILCCLFNQPWKTHMLKYCGFNKNIHFSNAIIWLKFIKDSSFKIATFHFNVFDTLILFFFHKNIIFLIKNFQRFYQKVNRVLLYFYTCKKHTPIIKYIFLSIHTMRVTDLFL